jgi:hypothetical protein
MGDLPDPERVQFPGPFPVHDVVVQGWTVPFLKASLKGETGVRLILDERKAIDLSSTEAENLLPFLADCIAVALGYGAHPTAEMTELPPELPHRSPRRTAHVVLPDPPATPEER